MIVLGIESSCDETAAAVLVDGRQVLSSVVASQDDVHAPYGGVVPELASRRHLEVIVPVVEKALLEAGVGLGDLDGIAVTYGPGLVGSLLVGCSMAKALAWVHGLPLVGVNLAQAIAWARRLAVIGVSHLAAHVYAGQLAEPDLHPLGGGEIERVRVAFRGEPLERRPTRIAQPEHPRALVERLARRVVERLTEQVEGVVAVDPRQQGVSAAGDQAHERRLERVRSEEAGRHVPAQVIDRRKRQPPRRGQPLRRLQAHEQRADQPRALGDRHQLDIVEAHVRARQRVVDDIVDQLEVVSGSDLGNDAAEAVVHAL